MRATKMMAAIVTVGVLAVAGCSSSDSSESTKSGASSASSSANGVPSEIKIGVDPGFGLPYVTFKGGKWSGLQPDYYAALGKELGTKFTFVSVKFDSLTPALNARRIDIAAGGFYDTPERQKSLNLIDNINLSTIALMKSGTKVSAISDLCGDTVALPAGDTTHGPQVKKASKSCTGGKSIKISYLDTAAGPLAVRSDRVQAYLIDNISGGYIASKTPGLVTHKLSDAGGTLLSGDGTRKDVDGLKLATQVAGAVDKIVANGTMAPILKKYGLPADTIPSPAKVNGTDG